MKIPMCHVSSVFVSVALIVGGVLLLAFNADTPDTFADENGISAISEFHHVIIYDGSEKLSVKTNADNVEEVLDRANISIAESDRVEPSLETMINSDNFYINIYRAHPAIIIDGTVSKYIMTASYDPATVAADAGLDIYDGDEIAPVANDNFLESGSVSTYKITRNGGRTITVEEPIPFTEEIVSDANMNAGETRVTQVGEDGVKLMKYQVNFIDGVEVSRELVSEEVTKQPVPRITTQGTKITVNATVAPGQETCANWVRQAGVSEADLAAALYLIYHESGCRVDAANPSGAYGIPQALPGSKMASAGADWQTNPVTQIRWMAGYVNRYGGWQGAYSFWLSHHWY